MPPERPLQPATAEDIQDALVYALKFDGRKRTHQADDFMARITAERLVKHLEKCGFVLFKQPQQWGDFSRVGSGPRQQDDRES
jgi:hypothetical protein